MRSGSMFVQISRITMERGSMIFPCHRSWNQTDHYGFAHFELWIRPGADMASQIMFSCFLSKPYQYSQAIFTERFYSIPTQACHCQTSVKKALTRPGHFEDHRSISKLSLFSKSIGHLLANQGNTYFSNDALLDKYQSVYIMFHST